MSSDYNTQREPIILKEYGRNVQKMVNHLSTIQDQEKKLKMAAALIEMMKQLNPAIQQNQDYFERLWNHIFIISDFKLDVEGAPVEKPETSIFDRKPEKVPYSSEKIKYLHYGKNLENMIDAAKKEVNPDTKKEMTLYIAKLMKRFYMTWNKEHVEDQLIIAQLEKLSNNELSLDFQEVQAGNLLYINPKDLVQQQQKITVPSKNHGNKNKKNKKKK